MSPRRIRNKIINEGNTIKYIDAETLSLAITEALEKQMKAQEEVETQAER